MYPFIYNLPAVWGSLDSVFLPVAMAPGAAAERCPYHRHGERLDVVAAAALAVEEADAVVEAVVGNRLLV